MSDKSPYKITKLANANPVAKSDVPPKEERYWDWRFAPCFTPFEIVEQGAFEGKYTAAIPGVKASYLKLPTVIKDRKEPGDVNLNKFKIMSRQLLPEWRKKGWLTAKSQLGWFQWFYHYVEDNRRIPEEDKLQIGRWSSFVSRHQGQIVANCKLSDNKCRPRQRQGLLQWGWDSSKERAATIHKTNVRRMAKLTDSKLEEGWEEKVDEMYSKFSTESAKFNVLDKW